MTTDTIILIIVAVFAACCFWKWLNWKSEAKFYTMMWKSEQDNNVNLFNLNKKLAEKARHDGPKVLAEDPVPYGKELQARPEPAPGCALQVHDPEDLAGSIMQVHIPKDLADPRNSDELKTQAAKTWEPQHRYRSKMHARGFVRACGDDGHSHWYPLDKTAWVKTSKKWSRVPIASKTFRNALAYFPGTDPKPTKARLVQLASELGTKMELMNDAKRNEARRRSA